MIHWKRPGLWVGLGLAALFVALVAIRIVQATSPEEPSPSVEEIREREGIPVQVAEAERSSIEVWRAFTGTVSGVRDAVVRARSSDQLATVEVAVGDRVERGETLVTVAGEATEARVRQSETALRQAERRVKRMRPLHEAGAISEQEWEDVLTGEEVARDDLAAVRDGLVLLSPLAGTVTEVPARPGMVPEPGEALVRIADLSGYLVRLRMSASDARRMEVGLRARLVEDPLLDGRVRRVALQADPLSRLVEVEVAFPTEARLIPGTFMGVEILTEEREEAVVVPREAVREGVVWVIDDEDRAERRSVETGARNGQEVEILDGIREGDRVVVQGASLLGDGTRVRVLDGGEG